ncbi:hypothetical protein D0Z07_9158 [Hyphodiscus hymeniophilus]|uniref:Uncharacterized protein n=1 Tax=Hyphodiscus hymeniophilus TaxID=353542 RepID=A0A9P6VDH0_9HELO|nr:hypothetical protein D0Z07_9158 [Hyphodiscus hymeniophilus]
MSRRDSDSFLPSGAMPSPPLFMPPSSSISPTMIPRSMPTNMDSYISPLTTSIHSPRNSSRSPARKPKPYILQHSCNSPSQKQPISPPKTRSASAELHPERLIDDWRNYTAKLRDQFAGERAHMEADRKRAEELMVDERSLWDEERNDMQAKISQLEQRLSQLEQSLENRGRLGGSVRGSRDTSMNRIQPGITQRQSIQQHALSFTSPGSNAVSVTNSVDGIPSRGVIPQESGRWPDGSPFYAPAARNPSRTFSSSSLPLDTLRVDDITAPRESAIRVTSKELTPSDFGPQSPSTHPPHRESSLDTIPETEPEKAITHDSIDISLIQPELEGVSIKASAVSPRFVAKVMSPDFSPVKLSPNIKPPTRDIDAAPLSRNGSLRSRDSKENSRGKLDTSTVMTHPVDRRLTMHAGHTPNHSISKFDFIESGAATPTQQTSDSHSHPTHTDTQIEHIHQPSIAHFDGAREGSGYGDMEDEDRELTGQLGLTNVKHKDDAFLAQLHERLEEAKKSEGVSPSESMSNRSEEVGLRNNTVRARMDDAENEDKEVDEMPRLKLKASTNFGRPLGSM